MNEEAYFKVFPDKAPFIRAHRFTGNRLRCLTPELAFGIKSRSQVYDIIYSTIYPWMYEMPFPSKIVSTQHAHFSIIAEKQSPAVEYEGRNIT